MMTVLLFCQGCIRRFSLIRSLFLSLSNLNRSYHPVVVVFVDVELLSLAVVVVLISANCYVS